MIVLSKKSDLLKKFVATFLSGHVDISSLAFVPKCNPVKLEDIQILKEYLDGCGRLCVLTGAGVSTESGLPDYRSEGVGMYATTSRRPMPYNDFCRSELNRKRYWARNFAGWSRFSSFKPNITHEIIQQLEVVGKVRCVITQNVDNLHLKAGSKNVIELHGTAFRVMCLNCDVKISRFALQESLIKLNPSMHALTDKIRPDGDVEISEEEIRNFVLPACTHCGGALKPDIVFFGDNVDRRVVQKVREEVESADALLILGTSLTTYSAYRIILQAVEAKKQIFMINIGPTRADELATLKLQARCGDVLPKIYGFQNTSCQASIE